jgi:membrane protease YdiL (CAAX protease family)
MSHAARAAITLGSASAGMIVFAVFAHQRLPWSAISAGGLIVAATAVSWAGQDTEGKGRPAGGSPGESFGLGRFSRATLALTLAGAGIGAAAGFWHRYGLEVPLQPQTSVQAFVIVACVIGAVEELLYRGWLMGQARAFGWPAAIVAAALAHAGYKAALFMWPAAPVPVDLWQMLWMTTAGGLVLGVLRAWSGSVWPAAAAHVVFDFVVYRGLTDAPWWVWR